MTPSYREIETAAEDLAALLRAAGRHVAAKRVRDIADEAILRCIDREADEAAKPAGTP